jgi:hypothetical protein
LDSAGAVFLCGQGETPAGCSWSDAALACTAAVGTTASEDTALKDLHGTMYDITGELRDVAGTQDAETGDNINMLACKP